MPVLVGIQIQPQHADYDAVRRAWREADDLGVDAIYTWDHFYPVYGNPDGKHFEALTLLGSMAEVTERAQIGALVICNSYRNADLLADAHRTIDHASGGRAILGIGAGWFQRDYDEYGYDYGTTADRVRALRGALPRIKDRLRKLNPPPIGRLPILIGGTGEQVTLKLVARYADMWHGFGRAERYARKNEVLERHCAAIARDPSEIQRTWTGWGDVSSQMAQIEDIVALGVEQVILGINGDGHGYDMGPVREMVAWRDRVNGGGAVQRPTASA